MAYNRYGVILVSGLMVRNDIKAMGEIFAKLKVVVLRCEYKYAEDKFEYVMYSPLFAEIEVGVRAPMYKVIVEEIRYDNSEEIDYNVKVEVEPYSTGKLVQDSLVLSTSYTVDEEEG